MKPRETCRMLFRGLIATVIGVSAQYVVAAGDQPVLMPSAALIDATRVGSGVMHSASDETTAARFAPMLAQAAPQTPAAPTAPAIRVTGAVAAPLVLTQADLKAFPQERWAESRIVRRSGDRDVEVAIRGVRLTAVLERAGLANTDRNGWKHTVVLATATDGYKVAFSWAELFNTPAGAQVIVVLERDGRPVDDAEGPIALVAVQDIRRGPRSVRGLLRLDVRVLGD